MRNKFYNFVVAWLLFLIFFCNNLFANDVIIDAKTVDITDGGNVIIAEGSVNISEGANIIITGDRAKYNKLDQNLEIFGNVILIDKEKNYKLSGKKVIFDRQKNLIDAYENIVFNDLTDKLRVESENIYYNKSKNIIKSVDKTNIKYKGDFLIKATDVYLDRNKNVINSEKKTVIYDNFNNIFQLSNFSLNLNEKIFKAQKIKLTDSENNFLNLNNGFVDLKTNELVGSDFNLIFNKETFGNIENDPRLIGRYIISNKATTSMKKSTFTTCKKVDGKCPAWSISAAEVKHIKEKKKIEYKNAWLEIYDKPVAYFPYFFHPDPTVKRQSGFLFPQFINSSNLGFATQIPYFKAIDIDKDMTISPRVYTNNNLFVQTEYRQANENSNFITDLSYNKKDSSNLHFFSTLDGNLDNSFYQMKMEMVSSKDYLKKYQIQSPLIKNYSVLNSSILFEEYGYNYSFSSSANVIEDLSKEDSDRYEYIFPNYEFTKETFLENKTFDTLKFTSSGIFRKYNTNVDEGDFINDFVFNSNNEDELKNLNRDFNILLRNINTYGDLSNSYKEDADYKILTSAVYNLKYPLIKNTKSGKSLLTPMASLRISPNKGLNIQNEDNLINFQDLFLLDRISNKTIETGAATTFGVEYKNYNSFSKERLSLGVGVNFRDKEDKDLPLSTSLGQKTSDIIGYSGLNVTENLSFSYNFSIDQNLSGTNYSLASLNYTGNKFKTSFEYLEKSNFIGDESYLNNFSELEIDKSNSIAFETNKNIDKNLTNYYNLIYKYKNDCLEASLVYNKQFYDEDSVNAGKNIFFKISFLPFGTLNSPNLND